MLDRRDDDTAGIFWPGYVDAISNLVLNLLFLLMIMTIGIFIYGLEMGIGASEKVTAPHDSVKPQAQIQAKLDVKTQTETSPKGRQVIVPATLSRPARENGLNDAENRRNEVIVKFNEDAIALTEQENEKLRQALKMIVPQGKANVFCDFPAGFSEAKRLCYYRAMAVRNILIEMDVPSELIDVKLRRSGKEAKSSIVKVTPGNDELE
jgi:hypothetical protein